MDRQPLKILHLTPTVGKGSTGVGAASLTLASAQHHLGYDARLWTMDSPDELGWVSESFGTEDNILRGFAQTRPSFFKLSLAMEREAASPICGGFSVVHQHGMWTGVSRVLSVLRRTHGTPTVIAPHGSLHVLALRRSRWKKRVALALYERGNLQESSCLQAVSEMEADVFRDFGLRNPIAVIPNGISTEWLESRGDGAEFRRHFSIPSGKRILLFLSRVSPMKGLTVLLEAVRAIGKDFTNWKLVIAGGDEFGHREELERIIRVAGLADTVLFVGPIFNQVKRDAFAAADLFVLPSFNEAAPIVVLEALAAGVPVIATKASPWRDLETHGCGWWVDINARAVGEALQDAVHTLPETLHEMGQKGRALIRSQYGWEKPARMTIELYDWLRGRGTRPGFVRTN